MLDILITSKQMDLLGIIRMGNADGTPCTVYDIQEKMLERYDKKFARDALMHMISRLEKVGYITRSRVRKGAVGRPMSVFAITLLGVPYARCLP